MWHLILGKKMIDTQNKINIIQIKRLIVGMKWK